MKRLFAAVLAALIIISLTACGGDTPASGNVTASPDVSTVSETGGSGADKIGFSLAGEGAFYDQLIADITSECAALGYEAEIVTADSGEKQQQDIEAMLAQDIRVIVVEPADVDSLETALAECETNGTQVISIIDSINGHYSLLISPDYAKAGQEAAQCAIELFDQAGGKCMMLKSEYNSLAIQLMSDGFDTAVKADNGVSLVSEKFCENEDEAYEDAKSQLSGEGADFIFAQSPELGRGAMRAVQDTGSGAKVVVYGGDMDIIKAVADGNIYAAIFFGPRKLAGVAVSYADSIIKSADYVPPLFVELQFTVVKQGDAQSYYTEGAPYAEAE